MIDPLSIAGVSLAAFDQLLKLGERTFELIQDSRAFDDDTRKLSNKIGDENLRLRLLRGLLFSEATIYGNKTLFEQFESDIQKQIQLLLGPLKGTLQEGCDLLERRYGVTQENPGLVSQTSNLSIASTLTPNTLVSPSRSKSPGLQDYFRWSFQDKKRVKTIVEEVSDQNNRVHEKIKLWCLASQLGVNVQHLQRLQRDEISRQLGFDVDATLRLTQWDALNSQASLELTDPSWNKHLKTITPVANQGKFATFTKDNKAYLQEGHDYETEARSPSDVLDTRTKKKVEDLAKLLHQPKEQVFRIPRCVGWKFMPIQKSIGFVFEMPSSPDAEPISLLRLLSSPGDKPELGDKFRLALKLARCISQLHMVKWVRIPPFPQPLSNKLTNNLSSSPSTGPRKLPQRKHPLLPLPQHPRLIHRPLGRRLQLQPTGILLLRRPRQLHPLGEHLPPPRTPRRTRKSLLQNPRHLRVGGRAAGDWAVGTSYSAGEEYVRPREE
jgi:Prion-inhibition and propagation